MSSKWISRVENPGGRKRGNENSEKHKFNLFLWLERVSKVELELCTLSADTGTTNIGALVTHGQILSCSWYLNSIATHTEKNVF